MDSRRVISRVAIVVAAISASIFTPLAAAQPALTHLVPFKWCQKYTPPLASHISYVRDCGGTMVPGIPIALDDWKCTQSGPIWRVVWWGALLPNQPTGIPLPNRFFIQVWLEDPNNPCKPGFSDFVYAVCVTAKFQFVGVDCRNQRVFRYTAPLPTPFTQVAGRKYWLQISEVEPNQPPLNPVGPRWCWSAHRPIELCPATQIVVPAAGGFQYLCPLLDRCDQQEDDLAFCLYRRAITGTLTPVPRIPSVFQASLLHLDTMEIVETQCIIPMDDGFFDVYFDVGEVEPPPPLEEGEAARTSSPNHYWLWLNGMAAVPTLYPQVIMLADGNHELGTWPLTYGDADNDGSVRFADIIKVLASFGAMGPIPPTATAPAPGEEPE